MRGRRFVAAASRCSGSKGVWVAGATGRRAVASGGGVRRFGGRFGPRLVRSVPSSCLSHPIRFEDTARLGV